MSRKSFFEGLLPRKKSTANTSLAADIVKEFEPSPALANLGGIGVLVIEDNEDLQRVMDIYLKKQGTAPHAALNGEEGVRRYLQNPDAYDVVFIDYQMPAMDGLQTATKIRASGMAGARTIPLVLMTGNITAEMQDSALFNYCLKKPFDVECLLGVISTLLNKGGGAASKNRVP